MNVWFDPYEHRATTFRPSAIVWGLKWLMARGPYGAAEIRRMD